MIFHEISRNLLIYNICLLLFNIFIRTFAVIINKLFDIMSEIKSIVSVIKILERTIGILENCNDFGTIPNVTRKRVIEMLNKATLEIYFLNAQESDSSNEQISGISKPSPEKAVTEIKPEHETAIYEYKEETTTEEEYIPDEEYSPDTEYVPDEEIPFIDEDELPEEETVTEEYIFQQQNYSSDKPIIEWEIPEPEPVQVTAETQETELNQLKTQLETERKRLEEELQSWQDEKRKKDEEILATKKLLEALQQQTAINQAKAQAQVQQSKPQQYQSQPAQPAQPAQPVQPVSPVQSTRRFQQSQLSAAADPPVKKEEISKKTARKEEPQEASPLIDRYIGSKKVLHENFESNSMVNQISSPVSSLSKVIGINDKFRFIKELFGGDSDLYNETIKILDTKGSLIAAISYIESNFAWDKNNDSVKQLISLIRRRYM
jgi:hypothetical protein